MYVERIEVPAFRVLRNVVLEFDRGYEPWIFPLGSENGGGKSTLLQLIFVLLHCSSNPARFPYLANLLATDAHAEDEEERLIARLTIRLDDESHVLEFVSLSDTFLNAHLETDALEWGFFAEIALTNQKSRLKTLAKRVERYNAASERDWSRLTTNRRIVTAALIRDAFGSDPINALTFQSEKELRDYLQKSLGEMHIEIEGIRLAIESLSAEWEQIKSLMITHGYKYITAYPYSRSSFETQFDRKAIVCTIPGQSHSKTAEVLEKLSSQIFLLGPSNQQYLFLDKDVRKSLLGSARREGEKTTRPQIDYLGHLDKAESIMNGFFAYDWLSVEPLVQLFKDARDADFKQVVKTGQYGNAFTQLLEEVSALLLRKQVRPQIDPKTNHVVGIEFLIKRSDGQETLLSPEDLSQGELKRLMIYAWLRANRAAGALVLIDEIEASFHPDWQYGIIRDLQAWAPSSQYILATHSYELCTALTPRHVRTLEPPLRSGPSDPTGGNA